MTENMNDIVDQIFDLLKDISSESENKIFVATKNKEIIDKIQISCSTVDILDDDIFYLNLNNYIVNKNNKLIGIFLKNH